MIYLFWLLPTLVLVAAIASGRLNVTSAALLGLVAAILVAVSSSPAPFGGSELTRALARGAWIGFTIVPYILGGLLFWQVAMRGAKQASLDTRASDEDLPKVPDVISTLARRRLLFFSCFLIGPFAEAATGFGVGMLGTVAMLRGLRLAPAHLMIFALTSQTLIPWGGMGSGTLLAAAYARMSAAELSLYVMVPVALLMFVWLPLFWRTARAAGLGVSSSECLYETGWVAAGLGLLTVATAYLGPETSLLAAYGPLIVLRHLRDSRPDRRQFLATARAVLPYVLLIGALVLSRLVPALREGLSSFGRLAPYADLPAWSPLFHAGSWLVAGGVLTALLRRQGGLLGREVRDTWRTGKHAALTVFLFPMMAEVLSAAGISQAFAEGMFVALQTEAILATPFVSGAFGILSNSGNAPNSLFMPSQLALAIQAGLSVPAVVALQHVSGTSMSFFSPIRMSIAASLAHGHGQERQVYAQLVWFAVAGFALLLAMAVWIIAAR